MEITRQLHYLPVPLGKIWTGVTLVDGSRMAVVDTAMRGDGEARILPYIKAQGLTTRSPLIINTHMHCDHIGSNRELADALAAEVFAHAADVPGIQDLDYQVEHLYEPFSPWLGQEVAAFRNWLHQVAGPTVPTVRALLEGDSLDLGPYSFQVLHTPGHSRGCITLYDPVSRVALAGDTVQVAGTVETGVPMLVDTAGYGRSLKRLRNLDIDLLVVDHPFQPFDEAVLRRPLAGEFLNEAIQVEERLARAVRRALREGGPSLSAWQAAGAVAEELGAQPNLFAVITAFAYLQEFQADGQAVPVKGDGSSPLHRFSRKEG